jgi:hypothetical protein
MLRRGRLVLVALAAGFALLAAPAHGGPAARSASACAQTREGQTLHIVLGYRYRSTLSRVDNTILYEHVLRDVKQPFATMTIGAATCLRPGGGWRVIDPIGVGYSSVGIDAAGNVRGKDLIKGWGIGITSGAGGSIPRIDVQVMHCGKGNFFKTLGLLSGVPIPGLKYVFDVARWAAGFFLPKDKVLCGDVGRTRLRVVPRQDGTLRIIQTNSELVESQFSHGDVIPDGMNSHQEYRVLPAVVRAG